MTKFIPLTKGQFAMVDNADFDWLSQFKWYAQKWRNGYYAARVDNGTIRRMHQVIMNPAAGLEPDHRDHNGLNNQRYNLRNVTHAQNTQNRRPKRNGSSSYRGVSWNKESKNWQVHIRPTGQKIKILGRFASETDAARAYDARAIEEYGEYAYLNFPQDYYT